MFLNGTKINRLYLGSTKIAEAYFNGHRVWPQISARQYQEYVDAVLAQRENEVWAGKNWGTAGGKWLFGASALTDHQNWGYPWGSFLDNHAVREMSNFINLEGLHNPGPLNINLNDPNLRIYDLVYAIIHWFILAWNPDQASKDWYNAVSVAYTNAVGMSRPPPNPADAVKQWQLLTANIHNLNTIDLDVNWRNNAQNIIDCAKIIFALTHRQAFKDAVAAYAKIITDADGTLPDVP